MPCNILVFVLLSIGIVLAQPNGWKMTDRFYGFRYELLGDVTNKGIELFVQQSANQLGCFGWIQKSPRNTLVGEARCSKKQGPIFEDIIKSKGESNTFLLYADTKIRLHFSSFKVLEDSRDTCFYDEPHRCEDIPKTENAGAGSRHEEL